MSNKYFENFELIRYNNSIAVNITERAAILSKVSSDRYAFYPYVVKNGMRAEQVAEKYYGDPNLFWLVYFSNNIINPYYDWPKDEDTFNSYIIDKYGSLQAARSKIVMYRVNWFEDTTNLSKIQYSLLAGHLKKYWQPNFDINNLPISYVRKQIDITSNATDEDGNITLSVEDDLEEAYWVAVSAYEMEEEENSKRAHIRLLDNRLVQNAVRDLNDLMKE